MQRSSRCGLGAWTAGRGLRAWSLRGAVLALGLTLAACVSTTESPAQSLAVKITIVDAAVSADGKVPLVVQFLEDDTLVELADGVTAACNTVPLTWNGLGYVGRVPQVAVGSPYEVSHVREGVTSKALVTAVPRPVITSPAAQELLPRSAALPVTFIAGGAARVRISATGPTDTVRGEPQADNGTGKLDARSLGAGAGTLSLTRELEGKLSGTGFAAATFAYSVETQIAVVWQ